MIINAIVATLEYVLVGTGHLSLTHGQYGFLYVQFILIFITVFLSRLFSSSAPSYAKPCPQYCLLMIQPSSPHPFPKDTPAAPICFPSYKTANYKNSANPSLTIISPRVILFRHRTNRNRTL